MTILPLLVAGFLLAWPSGGSCHPAVKVYPFPVDEVERILQAHFTEEGISAQTVKDREGRREIALTEGGAGCRIQLQPSSPLATELRFTCRGRAPRIQGLMAQLPALLDLIPPRGAVPADPFAGNYPDRLTRHLSAVACVQSQSGPDGKGIRIRHQQTGFAVLRDGLLLSTAHGLRPGETVRITFFGGGAVPGRIIKLDRSRDLAVIETENRPQNVIPLTGGRPTLTEDETVFAIGCPGNTNGTINPGRVRLPPRRMDRTILWQVEMNTLPGSSGSPVFDSEGRIAGMVKGRYRGVAEVGFLIPLETIIDFVKDR